MKDKILTSRKSLAYLEGWLSIVINTVLFGLKYWVGLRIHSVAMVADAWHTLSDTLTSIIVIIGFWFASRPADKKHSFGHGRAEAIASLIIGTLLAVIAFSFLKDSILRLIHHEAVNFTLFAVVVFLISAFIKEGLAQFSFWAGRKIQARSLVADAWHHRSDAVASGLIVVGAIVGKFFWWIDGVMGIGVSILILQAAYSIIRGASSYLMGESASSSLKNQIQDAIRKADASIQCESVHHLHVHDYGEHKELTAHIRLPADMKIDDAHDIVTKIEKAIKEELKLEITIHVEPSPAEKKDKEPG